MATAAKRRIASVYEVVPLGNLKPEHVVTPDFFVWRIVTVPREATQAGGFIQRAVASTTREAAVTTSPAASHRTSTTESLLT
jgi:hypothetical protein